MTKYVKVPTSIILEEKLSAREKIILVYLMARSGKSKQCFPSISLIAKEIGVAEKTAITALKKLRDRGFITITRRHNPDGGNSSNLYTVKNDAYLSSNG